MGAEISANSVRQSSFPRVFHQAALGEAACAQDDSCHYVGWDENRCDIPSRRIQFRAETYAKELVWMRGHEEQPSLAKICSHVSVTDGVFLPGSDSTDWKRGVCRLATADP